MAPDFLLDTVYPMSGHVAQRYATTFCYYQLILSSSKYKKLASTELSLFTTACPYIFIQITGTAGQPQQWFRFLA